MLKGNYIDGIHRPYNIPLKKEVVWVCAFLKNETKRRKKIILMLRFGDTLYILIH